MKKLLIAALFAVTFITSAFASEKKVGSSVMSKFKVEFKNATDVTWTAGEGFAKATFVMDDQRMEAFFSPSGEVLGTSKAITLDELTLKAKRSFAKRFDAYNVVEAIRFEGAEENAYYISASNEKETVIVKIDDADQLSIIKQVKK